MSRKHFRLHQFGVAMALLGGAVAAHASSVSLINVQTTPIAGGTSLTGAASYVAGAANSSGAYSVAYNMSSTAGGNTVTGPTQTAGTSTANPLSSSNFYYNFTLGGRFASGTGPAPVFKAEVTNVVTNGNVGSAPVTLAFYDSTAGIYLQRTTGLLATGNSISLTPFTLSAANLNSTCKSCALSDQFSIRVLDPNSVQAGSSASFNLVSSVPLPGALVLFGSGLLGLGLWSRKRRVV